MVEMADSDQYFIAPKGPLCGKLICLSQVFPYYFHSMVSNIYIHRKKKCPKNLNLFFIRHQKEL